MVGALRRAIDRSAINPSAQRRPSLTAEGLSTRRPHLRGPSFPAPSRPGQRLPHPQGGRPQPPAAGGTACQEGRHVQGIRAWLRPCGRQAPAHRRGASIRSRREPACAGGPVGLRTAGGEGRKRYLFVAIDRRSRWVHLAVKDDETEVGAVALLKEALPAFPFKVTYLLTDRGSCFTADGFEKACRELSVEHRKTKPYTPVSAKQVLETASIFPNSYLSRHAIGLALPFGLSRLSRSGGSWEIPAAPCAPRRRGSRDKGQDRRAAPCRWRSS